MITDPSFSKKTNTMLAMYLITLTTAQGTFIKPCFPDDEVHQVCRPGSKYNCHDTQMAHIELTALDGVKTGHIQEVELEDGRYYRLITRALKPVIFEIPNFLSEAECDYIIKLANTSELRQSMVGLMKDGYDGDLDAKLNAVDQSKPAEGPDELLAEKFESWDKNGDSTISFEEIANFAFKYDKLYIKKDQVADMLKRIGFQEYQKGVISKEEFQKHGVKKMLAYMQYLKDKHPLYRHRVSEQIWLHRNMSDPVLLRIIERVTRLTKLPAKIVRTNEAIQVVRYQQNGHYHAHYDSHPITNNFYCCHQNLFNREECKLCRFITILYYLNDVDQGGETAFPIADQPSRLSSHKKSRGTGETYDELNLSEHCQNASLVIPPKKGTAVMWYNHLIDKDTGFLGDLDEFSVHGGCDIKKGTKWIANNWIAAPTSLTAHIKSIYDVDH